MPSKTSNLGKKSKKTRKSKNRGPRRTRSQQMRNYYNTGRPFSPNIPRGPHGLVEAEL